MKVCEDCGKEFESNGSSFCPECLVRVNEDGEKSLENREAEPEEHDQDIDDAQQETADASGSKPDTGSDNSPAGLKQAAIQKATQRAIGSDNAERATAISDSVQRISAQTRATVARTKWAVSGFITTVTNPVFWISVAAVIVIFLISNITVTTYQTVGSMRDASAPGGGSGMAGEVLQRLAQRGVLLAQDAYKYPNSDAFVAAHGGDPKRTNGNAWAAACPDIVNIIYGLPEHYAGNNGIDNAYSNYQRLVASGMKAQSWYFPETSSPGATMANPPAGAIVSSTSGSVYGHTYVVLTSDGKVIDNTWNIRSGGPATGLGYRVLSDASRAMIRGWFVPPATGYEGTFLKTDPMLPAAPAWSVSSGGTAPAPAS